ncbi:CAP domain-containing protein [Luteolibacter marinus]|uniref:CAP domain-containing protein n=1 Tax=Luteolibacter marinus TaxID=2776705 RepID=UPI0018669B15|nr:CAP domain-containing protein [Luteolibacter marinus]
MRLVPLLLCAATLTVNGQTTAPPADFVKRAGQWMISPDPAKRQAAYRSWLQLGEGAMKDYEKALRISQKYHEQKIDKVTRGESGKNPYEIFDLECRELESERERVMKLIRTDWKKEGRKIDMLRDEMKSLTKLHARVNKLALADTKTFDAAFDAAVSGLCEATRELERFEEEPEFATLDDEEMREELIAGHLEAKNLVKLRDKLLAAREAMTRLAATDKANKEAGNWADSSMYEFAKVLNRERDVCGLTPLRLEEKLSDASKGHSADMARLGFFAHESPVPNKKTPWDRARLAGFTGNASGENIYMGSTNFQAAYDGWFGSDGHRFIMFAGGPNVLGVGISGVHWTMMTGSKN